MSQGPVQPSLAAPVEPVAGHTFRTATFKRANPRRLSVTRLGGTSPTRPIVAYLYGVVTTAQTPHGGDPATVTVKAVRIIDPTLRRPDAQHVDRNVTDHSNSIVSRFGTLRR